MLLSASSVPAGPRAWARSVRLLVFTGAAVVVGGPRMKAFEHLSFGNSLPGTSGERVWARIESVPETGPFPEVQEAPHGPEDGR
ncbi:MAG: hypothetical protein AVDCRST_MAG22-3273 [uncultured Rubrobacteraceae bacterium]|uniref:Uncharacterized protein n=1 Tax=uncultured Rubrobacteraceae bacterium TaxID=349277 RepID=A0A6J4Q1Y8_9ACTN|nr:MAG: hypothetical protein AVDCRST_MAG22-3273 [uncultured Rubrobacteraceae bacterium]